MSLVVMACNSKLASLIVNLNQLEIGEINVKILI